MKFRSVFASASALFASAQLAFCLVEKPNVAPVLVDSVGDQQIYVETTRIVDLTPFFSDPDATAAARLVTPLGTMNFTLDGATTPITVANFLSYVNSGRYAGTDPTTGQPTATFFHRSVPNFIIQAGGFLDTVNPSNGTALQPTQVLAYPAIQNEPVISNRRATIAMAKIGGDPNSATSQWFVNLADNSANLDFQNGGFTVFGRVAGDGITVADAIGTLPRYNGGSPFDELPVRDYVTGSGLPKPSNTVTISPFTQISPLVYSAASDNESVATASAAGIDLLVQAKQVGTAHITVTATDLDGAAISQTLTATVVSAPGRLTNISTRANFPTGDDVLISGFIVRGGTSKQIVVRALGPSLSNAGIANPLPDPKVQLFDATGTMIAQNDNWGDGANTDLLSGLDLAPSDPKEAALLITVPSGAPDAGYTAIVRSASGVGGVSLVEVYDVESGPGANVYNLSTRGQVGTGDNVLIGGFILRGSDPRRIVIRALGPSLADSGVDDVLADPKLSLFNSQGTLLASNDNWQDTPNAGEIQMDNLAPPNPRESALITTLAAGPYTAIISGVGEQPTGVALVELYQVQ